jgi:hypothetical protein
MALFLFERLDTIESDRSISIINNPCENILTLAYCLGVGHYQGVSKPDDSSEQLSVQNIASVCRNFADFSRIVPRASLERLIFDYYQAREHKRERFIVEMCPFFRRQLYFVGCRQ